MLRVTLEIIPWGDENHPRRRQIGSLTIGLQRMKDNDIGEYSSVIFTDSKCPAPHPVVLIDHPRNKGAFELVKHAFIKHLSAHTEEIPDEVAKAFLAEIVDYENIVREAADIVEFEPDACADCGRTDLMGCEYTYDHPNYYDGISEWSCACGARTGRWSGKILKEGQSERPFGQ